MIMLQVVGDPAPQGSHRAMMAGGRPIVVHGSSKVGELKIASWREAVNGAATQWWILAGKPAPLDEPVHMAVTFWLTRPKSRPAHRFPYPDRKPDASKLLRSTEDALAAVLADDARIVSHTVEKRYADSCPTGALIVLSTMAERMAPLGNAGGLPAHQLEVQQNGRR